MSLTPSMAAPWKQLILSALETNAHLKHNRFIQLATVTPNGQPSNRTVVFRSVGTSPIHGSNSVLVGGLTSLMHHILIPQSYREKAWFSSSLNSRLQYLVPHPGLPRIVDEPEEGVDLDPLKGPVNAFCVLEFDPEKVDYLNLKTNERLVYKSEKIGDRMRHWVIQEVNP
ncbi:pyridoxamine 5'-phosphate oxidase family protein isoform X2 [Wolffia australiana]